MPVFITKNKSASVDGGFKMSIKKSIRIILIISSMIPVILVSVIAHGLLTNRLIDVNTQILQQTAKTSKSGLEAMIDTQRTEVSLLSIQKELMDTVNLSNHANKFSNDAVNELLQTRCNSYDECERISLYNIDHKVIASSDPSILGNNTDSDLTLTYMLATKDIAIGIGGLKPFNKLGKIVYVLEIGAPIIDVDNDVILGYVISN